MQVVALTSGIYTLARRGISSPFALDRCCRAAIRCSVNVQFYSGPLSQIAKRSLESVRCLLPHGLELGQSRGDGHPLWRDIFSFSSSPESYVCCDRLPLRIIQQIWSSFPR